MNPTMADTWRHDMGEWWCRL